METNSPNGGRQSEATAGTPPQSQSRDDDMQSRQPVSGDTQKSGRTASQVPTQDRSRSMSRRSGGDLSRSSGGYTPFNTMARLSREMDQLFDSFFGSRFGSRFARNWPFESRGTGAGADEFSSLWTPSVDMKRRGDSVVIHAELPGVSKDAVRIEATDDGIAITGERSETREEGGADQNFQLKERSYGSFYREIALPEGAQVEQAKATMREGVLEITVPVQESQNRRQIQIEG